MASVQDTMGPDGVLRGILTKTLNEQPTPFYPKTHSDSVSYKESSVEGALNELYKAQSNLSTLMKETRKTLKDLGDDSYSKSHIDEVYSTLMRKLSSAIVTMTNLTSTVHGLHTYSTEVIDQKVAIIDTRLIAEIAAVNFSITQLMEQIIHTFMDKASAEERIVDITSAFNRFSSNIDERMNNLLNQFRAEMNDVFDERLKAYYDKSDVDSMREADNKKLSQMKGDVMLMNFETAENVKDRLNAIRDSLIEQNSRMLDATVANIKAQMSPQLKEMSSVLDALNGVVSSVNNKVTSQSSYPNADEVKY